MTLVAALEHGPIDPKGVDAWLYAGQDTARRLDLERGVLAEVPRIEAADALQRKGSELRTPYLDWVGSIGAANDTVEWWASELAARTSYTLFYDRVCALAAALEMPSEQTTLVICPSPAFAATLGSLRRRHERSRRSGARLLRAWTRSAPRALHALPGRVSNRARLLLDSDPRYRRRILAAHGALEQRPFTGTLLFTWIDARSFGPDGTYADPHFGPLAAMLRGRGIEVAFVPRVLPNFSFAEAVQRLLATGETFFFPDVYIDVGDQRDCARRAAAFSPAIADDAAVAGVPVALLAREHIEQYRSSQASALATGALVRRFASAGVRPERIVHPCEGHGWELVLAWSARRHLPGTSVVGYDNLNMSTLALSMFPARSEIGVRPLPDHIVTNGPAYRDVLVREGVPNGIVRTGCALRHRYLWEAAQARRPRAERLRILVATELALGPSVELVDKATCAFDGADVDLVVKAHPLQPRDEIVRVLGERAASLDFEDRPTLELLAEADVVLYTYSAVGYEALALGVPPVFVRSDSRLDLDQLEYARELRWEGRTPADLRAAVDAIAEVDLDVWRERARGAARAALAPPSPDCVDAFL